MSFKLHAQDYERRAHLGRKYNSPSSEQLDILYLKYILYLSTSLLKHIYIQMHYIYKKLYIKRDF